MICVLHYGFTATRTLKFHFAIFRRSGSLKGIGKINTLGNEHRIKEHQIKESETFYIVINQKTDIQNLFFQPH